MSQEEPALPPKYRPLSKRWRIVAVAFPVMALLMAFMVIFRIRPFGFMLIELSYFYLLLGVFIPLAFLWIPFNRKASRDSVPWYDIVLIVLTIAASLYFVAKEHELLLLGWEAGAPTVPMLIGALLWVLMIEAGRRSAGPAFAIVVFFFSIYPIFASNMPGFLWGRDFSFSQVASFHAMSEESIMGIPIRIFGRVLLGYMIFAIVLQRIGAGRFFNEMATSLVGKTRGGTAKIAIVASGFFGSISGSGVSNVMTTGTFTIPAMKKEGLPPHFAGAVEACASSGGALMPPIMGTAAFLMAEFLEIPYVEVAIAAAIPAILYYVCLFAQIDSYAARVGLVPKTVTFETPPVWRILYNNLHIILSVIFLIVILFALRLTSQAPWIATAAAIVMAMFRKETRLNPRTLIGLLEALGRSLGELLSIMAPVGLIIGAFVLTGVAFSLPHEMLGMAGGNMFFLLLLGALAAFILGMGLNIAATYIFLAIAVAPGLHLAGFDLLASHLFVLYAAIWSHITPPVAMSAFAAASISGASPMRTGFKAMQLGVAKYILPFIFITSPALILRGPVSDMLLVIPTALIGLVVISGGLEGYFWRIGHLTILSRGLFFGAGLLLAIPGLRTDLYGLGILVLLFVLVYLLRGRSPLSRVLLLRT